MSSTPVAHALLHAYRDRFTGFVHVISGGRTSRLGFLEGHLVDAEVRFGHQTAAQALLQLGRLDVFALDALWARGAGGAPDGAVLAELGVAADAVEPARALACVRQLSAVGEAAELEAQDVEPRFHLPGPRAVRAAFEAADDGESAQTLYRCVDAVGCAEWCESDEELELVSQLAWAEAPPELDPARRALLRVLELQGSIEARDASEVAREARSEEMPVLDAEPLAEDGGDPEALEDYENILIGGDEPEAEADLGDGGTAVFGASTISEETAPDAADVQPDWAADVPEEDLAAARRRAQDELAREMNEALRRAGAAPVEAWLEDDREAAPDVTVPPDAAEPQAAEPEPEHAEWQAAGGEAADVHQTQEPEPTPAPSLSPEEEYWTARSPEPLQPLRFEPRGDEAQDDLWRLVHFDQPSAEPGPSEPNSFEEALRKVDQNLERLVGMSFQDLAAPEESAEAATIEPIVEEIESTWVGSAPTPAHAEMGDSPDTSVQTPDELAEDWRLEEEDLANEPSDPAEAARLRRQRLLRRAMENIGTLPRPARENAEAVVTIEPSAAVPPPPSAQAQPDAESLSQAERKIAASIEDRHRALADKPTHFAVLGLGAHPTKEQVKAAFLEQAKVFHPDRLPGSLAALAPKMTAVFEAIREAYEVLYDDQRRRQYEQALQAQAEQPKGGPDPRVVAQASDEFKKGEVHFRRRDFAKAEECYVRAYSMDSKAEYLAARAWAVYMDPGRKHEAPRAKQMLQDALKANPSCDRAHYQLGIIARVENDLALAERHFREAVKANPRHLEANQELRVIEMRKKKSGKKGLFS